MAPFIVYQAGSALPRDLSTQTKVVDASRINPIGKGGAKLLICDSFCLAS